MNTIKLNQLLSQVPSIDHHPAPKNSQSIQHLDSVAQRARNFQESKRIHGGIFHAALSLVEKRLAEIKCEREKSLFEEARMEEEMVKELEGSMQWFQSCERGTRESSGNSSFS